MKAKGLEVNVGKTKEMIGGEVLSTVEEFGSHPCGVCGKDVGNNSFMCISCSKWVHRRCSNVKGSLQAAATVFDCLSVGDAQRAVETHRMLQCKGMVSILGMVIFWKVWESFVSWSIR